MSRTNLLPSWAHAIRDMALDLALRSSTEAQFMEQWMRLGTVVRYLATHERMPPPVLTWGRWEWWRP